MGMRVIGVKRTRASLEDVDTVYGPEDMARVFQQSDYVINLLPATPATEKLIDHRFFGAMKPTASFMDLGRGTTVNETDLIEALRNQRIKALVSDVYETEPLPAASPLWEIGKCHPDTAHLPVHPLYRRVPWRSSRTTWRYTCPAGGR